MAEDRDQPDLTGLRARIDAIDEQILGLLRKRMEVVGEVAAYKQATGTRIRDHRRERDLLDARRARAEVLGLSAEPVEAIYRQVMLASRDHQAALGAAVTTKQAPRRVAIIGGKGAMGGVLSGMFSDLGHRVSIVDLDTELSAADAARASDVVVISVPIDVTSEVIAEVGPHMPAAGLLIDVTSLKQEPLQAMLDATAASGASVVGCHPMFGPGVHTLMGQRIVMCEGRGEVAYEWLKTAFEARGLVVTESSAEAHDRAMALVQVLTHFQTQVLGVALSRAGVPLSDSLQFTSPAYLMELYVAARHFAQAPALYGPIEMRNPRTAEITAGFTAAAAELAAVLARRDQRAFEAMFAEVRAFFGDFALEATEQSRFLIDRLVERSMG